MKRRWVALGSTLLVLLLVTSFAAVSATSTRFRAGTEIQFKIQDSATWFWGCCGCCECEDTLVNGWRIVSTAEQVIYSVAHDAAVPSSVWVGSWNQMDIGGTAVPAGYYKLYVDTSAGTLSRCFSVYDPCACNWCWNPCTMCACEDVACINQCACRTSLVFVDPCGAQGCLPLFWWWGSCGCSSCP